MLINGLSAPSRDTREAIARLSAELSTGRIEDVPEALRHDFSALGLAERDLALSDGLRLSIAHGQRVTQAAEHALQGIATELDEVRDDLVPLITGGAPTDLGGLAQASWNSFDRVVSLLNTRQDGGAVFAGGRSDTGAAASAQDLRSDLQAIAALATDATDLTARIGAYFADGGDFQTNRVPPGAPASYGFRLAANEIATVDARGDDSEFRAALATIASVASVAGSAFAMDDDARQFLAIDATPALLSATDGVTNARAEMGRLGARTDTAGELLTAQVRQAEVARSDLIGADPFETATRLEQEVARLETIYTLTARLSRLRLTDYL